MSEASTANYTEAELREQVRVLTDAVAMWKSSSEGWMEECEMLRTDLERYQDDSTPPSELPSWA